MSFLTSLDDEREIIDEIELFDSRLPWSIQTRRSLFYVVHVALTVRLSLSLSSSLVHDTELS